MNNNVSYSAKNEVASLVQRRTKYERLLVGK